MRDWLGEMFGQIGERFDQMDERFDRLEARVDEIVTVNGTLIDEVARINRRLA